MDTPAKNAWKKAYLSTVGTSSPKTPGKGSSVLYVSRRLSCASQGFEIIWLVGLSWIFGLPEKQKWPGHSAPMKGRLNPGRLAVL